MKMLWTTVFLTAVLCGVALTQDGTAPPTRTAPLNGPQTPTTPAASNSAPTNGLRIAAGSVIPVELTKSIDAKKLKTGEEIEAKVTQDLKSGSGELIVPKNTKVLGRVTEVEAGNKEQKESQVGISFDHAVIKNGDSVPLAMSIQAIIAPPNSNPNNGYASEGAGQSAPGSGGGMQGNNAARSAGTGVGAAPPPSPGSSGDDANSAQSSANSRQPINGNTQGVIGLSHLKLSTAADATQGSLISSDKGNVKVDSGTFMLLRVQQ
jgi:hypothetical protein